jgi:hypothetical protein
MPEPDPILGLWNAHVRGGGASAPPLPAIFIMKNNMIMFFVAGLSYLEQCNFIEIGSQRLCVET